MTTPLVCDEKPPLAESVSLLTKVLQDLGADLLDLCTVKRRSHTEGFAFLSKTLPLLGKAFDRGLGDSAFKLPSVFKRWRKKTEIPAFLGSFFRDVFHDDGRLREDANANSVYAIRQVCFLFYKYEVPPSSDVTDRQFVEWINTDQGLPDHFPDDPTLDKAAELAREVFGDFNRTDLVFRHGPGAVSDCPRHKKYGYRPLITNRAISHFGLSSYFLRREVDSTLWLFRSSLIFGSKHLFAYFALSSFEFFPLRSKLISVPKDSRGGRLINEEPLLHQWYQQGIMKWTVNRLESHRLTRGSVNFTDQSINRNLAVVASKRRNLATVDLSEASDRVSYALVKKIFRDCPEYFAALDSSRTKFAEVTLSTGVHDVSIKKFAAMGSAVCFTTLAFAVYALILAELSIFTLKSMSKLKDDVYVYGDDIICPSAYFPFVKRVLERYSLKVNVGKSFIGSRFSESCGMDAFDGNNVTPLRVRKLLSSVTIKSKRVLKCIRDTDLSESVVKTVKLAQNLYLKGLWCSSEYCYSLVERSLCQKLPFGTKTSPYLCRITEPDQVGYLNRSLGICSIRTFTRGEIYDPWLTKPGTPVSFDDSREVLKAYGIVPEYIKSPELPYERLRRTLPMLGGEYLPNHGEFPDRGFTLHRRIFQNRSAD